MHMHQEVKFNQRANTRRPIFIARMRDPTADWPGIIEDLRRGSQCRGGNL